MRKFIGQLFKAEKVKAILAMSVCLTIGFTAGIFFENEYNLHASTQEKTGSNRLGQNKLINPLLDSEFGADRLRNRQLQPFKNKIYSLIEEKKRSGDASEIAVYFRDLNDGMAFNINGTKGFEPASLIKIPLMIIFLKHAETDSGLLARKLVYDGKTDWNKDSFFKPRFNLDAGKDYTVEDLIRRMIAYSDNNAFRLLLSIFDRADMEKLHNELGIEMIRDASGTALVTVKSYSIFMRVLYNASYLDKAMSEKALELLAVEEFPEGMSDSVPPDMVVASKFGERSTGANGEIKQLHDIGIIYYSNRPYLLSIMTQGKDFKQLALTLRSISKIIYEEVLASEKRS